MIQIEIMPDIRDKIIDRDTMREICNSARSSGSRVGLAHGCFDLMHTGHIMHLEEARKLCDILMVSITADQYVNKGPNRPVFNHDVRAYTIASLQCVDYVTINYGTSACELLEHVAPTYYIKGRDYATSNDYYLNQERLSVEKGSGSLIFTESELYSSSEIINKYFSKYCDNVDEYLTDMRARYGYDYMCDAMDRISKVNILVLGESIIDRYVYVDVKNKASKSAVLSSRYIGEENMLGASLHIANHLAEICNNVCLVTVVGNDHYKYESDNRLNDKIHKIMYSRDAPTMVKTRYVEPTYMLKMFEMATYNDNQIGDTDTDTLITEINNIINDYDVLMIADFGQEVFNSKMIGYANSSSKYKGIMVQTNSLNYGYNMASKYANGNYLCIDTTELRLMIRDKTSPVEDIVPLIRDYIDVSDIVSITMGNKGSITYDMRSSTAYSTPSLALGVVDATGAGDVYYSYTLPASYIGLPYDVIGFLGNAAAALSVQSKCTSKVVTKTSFMNFIKSLMK